MRISDYSSDVCSSDLGKTRAELAQGLDRGIGQFNIEHEPEGIALAEIAARKDMTAPAVLRVNTDVDAGTHAKISTGKAENKFGVGIDTAPEISARLSGLPGLKRSGIGAHIGRRLPSPAPLAAALQRSDERRAGQECY